MFAVKRALTRGRHFLRGVTRCNPGSQRYLWYDAERDYKIRAKVVIEFWKKRKPSIRGRCRLGRVHPGDYRG